MDRNFDDIAHRFDKNIYSSPKGEIRLAIVWDDLEKIIPGSEASSIWRILDAGAGTGQIAARLARRGHHLVLCDISKNMLELARKHLEESGVDQQVEFRQVSIQQLVKTETSTYDMVVLHAVLEWVEDPWNLLEQAVIPLKKGGYLSLLFYNRHSLVLRNVLRGNFRKVKSGQFQGDPGSLTPNHPLCPDDVYNKLADMGFKIAHCSGVRMFYDYLSRDMREQRSLEDVLEMERMFCHQEPYRSMARYVHVIARRT